MKKTENAENDRSYNGKELIGEVVSTKLTKTVIVAVTHAYKHPIYKKPLRRTQKFSAHNEALDLSVGDRVKIAETKPMSKTKHFIVVGKIG